MGIASAATTSPGSAQAAPVEGGGEPAVEWNFRPAPASAAEVSLQERWAAPFAVESTGRPPPRGPRRVVVLRDTAARPVAAEDQVEEGESVAEVTVEGSAAVPDPPTSSATRTEPAATAAGEFRPTADDEATPVARSAAAASAPPSADADGIRTHRVEYGETWYGLAREYRVSSRDLAAANPEVDPERLRSGTVLRIPPAAAAAGARRTHTVGRGDTLFGIARRYGVSAAALRSANGLTGDIVRLGQTLVIPREEGSR